jgi:hypothetical protein
MTPRSLEKVKAVQMPAWSLQEVIGVSRPQAPQQALTSRLPGLSLSDSNSDG